VTLVGWLVAMSMLLDESWALWADPGRELSVYAELEDEIDPVVPPEAEATTVDARKAMTRARMLGLDVGALLVRCRGVVVVVGLL
jgi:hypothetical protein